MDYQISISQDEDYVLIKAFKPMTSEIARSMGPEAAELGEKHDIHKYLFDVRDAPNIQSVAKNYTFAYKELPETAFPKSSISAFLISEGDRSHEFIELAFKNAGYQIKSFTCEEEALNWLKMN
jgi:hypothetical protein